MIQQDMISHQENANYNYMISLLTRIAKIQRTEETLDW